MSRRGTVTRRNLLQAGALLPFTLPAGLPIGKARAAEPTGSPRRFIVFYVPEGCVPETWWPTPGASDTDYTFSPSLKPLEPYRGDISIFRGFASGDGGHASGAAETLTAGRGSPARTVNGVALGPGTSLDQAIAAVIRGQTPVRSYQLGIQSLKTTGGSYGPHISYEGKTARPAQNSPVKAFDELVAGISVGTPVDAEARRRRLLSRKSVVDSVLPELQALRCKVGSAGREKIDIHVDGIRRIEQQIERSLAQRATGGAMTIDRSFENQSVWFNNANYPKIGKMQMDIVVSALAADVTRVVTLQWAMTGSDVRHSWLDINYKDAGWHLLSHNGDGSLKSELSRQDRTKIYAWYAEQLVYLIKRLKETPDVSGTLFDNTAILYCSEMSNGAHNSTNIPFLLAGKAGGRFRNGSFFDETNAAKRERTTYRWNNDLFAAIGKGFGLEIDSFGSSDRSSRDQYSKGLYSKILV